MTLLIVIGFALALWLSIIFRTVVFHPFKTVFYAFKDFLVWLKYKKWRVLNSGFIICFIGLFGKGKTLASVHYVLKQYKRYNNKRIYDFDRKKWVTQVV